jgi:hypothetical protein
MKEKDLIKLGFSKQEITPKESGSKNKWHYYTLDVGDICLISNDNEEASEEGFWAVYFFDVDSLAITDPDDLEQLIIILKRNTFQ